MAHFLSIVIPVFNRASLIKACLDSVLAQSIGQFELIVVDDASNDQTVAVVRSFLDPRIRLFVNDKNRGVSYCRNKAIALAQGDIVVFIDSDCVAQPNWLSELIKPFELREDIVIVGGRIIDPPAVTYWEKVNGGMNYICSQSGYVTKVISCNMAARKSFLAGNPFDEDFSSGEDCELCCRALQRSFKIFYSDPAQVMHYHRSSLKSTLRQHFDYGCNNARLNSKHRRFPLLNYGSWLLLAIGGASILETHDRIFLILKIVFCSLYAILIGYWNTRGWTRPFKEWVISFPGYVLVYSTFCLGNLCFPFIVCTGLFF